MDINERAYRYYFHFASHRMQVFWNRYNAVKKPWTHDPIIRKFKFTNTYRALDRVSQYLISNIIYAKNKEYDPEDVLFRILLFKVFNRIDTWEFLENTFGDISISSFDVKKYSKSLDKRIKTRPIFNAAYIMTASHNLYKQYPSKHERWLHMIEDEFIIKGGFREIQKLKSLKSLFEFLKSKPFLGPFLAYQYAIDFNYSKVLDFDENEFVKAGIGAIRGIKKCFPNIKPKDYEKAIMFTQENFDFYLSKYGYNTFKDLFGRKPTLIDLQNCFCETDKYLRVKMPELNLGNIRIKQKYDSGNRDQISFFFPPKWNISTKKEQSFYPKKDNGTLF